MLYVKKTIFIGNAIGIDIGIVYRAAQLVFFILISFVRVIFSFPDFWISGYLLECIATLIVKI